MAEVTITVGGIAHKVPLPLGLDVLEDAGDAIDRAQDLLPELAPYLEEGKNPPVRLLAKAGRAALEVFCIAINTEAPGSIDFEAVAKRSSLEDASPLVVALGDALRGSGFEKGSAEGERGGERPNASASPSKRKSAASSRASR
jgi:hypothetical protein